MESIVFREGRKTILRGMFFVIFLLAEEPATGIANTLLKFFTL